MPFKDEVLKAEAGEDYLITSCEDPFHSELPKKHWKKGEVKVSCGKNSSLGRWACLTHHVVFGNQMNKDGHIIKGNHRLAWWCPKCCSYETP